jgi:hypothetical protein
MNDGIGNLLCLKCRKHGHGTPTCMQTSTAPTSEYTAFDEAKLLESLRQKSSSLCEKCSTYKILEVFDTNNITDMTDNLARIDSINHTANVMTDWVDEKNKHNMDLGPLRSIILTASCQLCRLIFRVFPRQDVETTSHEESYYLRPFPSYDRQSSFLKKTDKNLKAQYAIHFSVESEEKALGNVMTHFADPDSEMINRVLVSFALSSKNPASIRKSLGSRRRNGQVDFGLLRRWLKRCASFHGVSCRRTWSDQLVTTRMIDVDARHVVQCPPGCEYVALSYVWGAIVPEKDALKNRRLPQTIEDTMLATKQLGFQYLWV